MTSNFALPALALVASLLSSGTALAQSVGPDEPIGPNGVAGQQLALTPAQKSAIYNAVIRQRVRNYRPPIQLTVGAPVPPTVELLDLPEQTAITGPGPGFLKYAMVDDDVVVVDPIRMQVVDIIHRGTGP